MASTTINVSTSNTSQTYKITFNATTSGWSVVFYKGGSALYGNFQKILVKVDGTSIYNGASGSFPSGQSGDFTVASGTYTLSEGTHNIYFYMYPDAGTSSNHIGWYVKSCEATLQVSVESSNYNVSISASTGGSVDWSSIALPKTSIWTCAYSNNTIQIKQGGTLAYTITATPNDGYKFSNWKPTTAPETINKDVSFTAMFSENTYTVTYNGNGGTASKITQTNTFGTALDATATRTGYEFSGWYTTASGGTKRTTIVQTETLYAHWTTQIVEVTVKSNDSDKGKISYNQGSATGSVQIRVDSNATYVASATNHLIQITSGQTTHNFSLLPETDCYLASVTGQGSGIIGTSGKTFTANFVSVPRYQITYKPNGGDTTPSPTSGLSGETVYLAAAITKSGRTPSSKSVTFNGNQGSVSPGGSNTAGYYTEYYYDFNGWKIGSDIYDAGDPYKITANVDATAQWGSIHATDKDYWNVVFPNATRTGYEMLGWSTSSSATTATYSVGQNLTYALVSDGQTYYAVWKEIKYYGQLKLNKGTYGTADVIINSEALSSSIWSYTLKSTDVTPSTSATQAFVGWDSNQSAPDPDYTVGSEVKDMSAASTDPSQPTVTQLYAIWQYTPKYSVTVDTAHPSADACSSSSANPSTGISSGGSSQLNCAAAAGYEFVKWQQKVNGNWIDIPNATSTSFTLTNITMDKVVRPYFRFVYTLYGYYKYGTEQTSQNYWAGVLETRYGQPYTLEDAEEYQDSHTPPGWHIKLPYGHTVVGQTLYVYYYHERNEYSITYNANEGTGGLPNPQTKYYGVELTLRRNNGQEEGQLTREGYTCVGWNTEADGSGTGYELGGIYTLNEAAVLYAQWQTLHYGRLTLLRNIEGSSDKDIDSGGIAVDTWSHTFTEDDKVSPLNDAYELIGWDENDRPDNPTYTVDSLINLSAASTSLWNPTIKYLYAIWSYNPTRYGKVVFNPNGGTAGTTTESQTFVSRSTQYIYRIPSSAVPTRTSYQFLGWNTAGQTGEAYHEGNQYTFNKSNTTSTDPTITELYAHWLKVVRAEFNADGGTASVAYQEGVIGTTITATATKPGYVFAGWYTDKGAAGTQRTTLQDNETLFAHWTTTTVNVTVSAGTHGQIKYNGSTSSSFTIQCDSNAIFYPDRLTHTLSIVNGQYTYTFTAEPDTGYYLLGWNPEQSGVVGIEGRTIQANFTDQDNCRVLATITPAYGDTTGISAVEPTGIQIVDPLVGQTYTATVDTNKVTVDPSTWRDIDIYEGQNDLLAYEFNQWQIETGSGLFLTPASETSIFKPTSTRVTIYPTAKTYDTGLTAYRWNCYYEENGGTGYSREVKQSTGWNATPTHDSKKPITIQPLPTAWQKELAYFGGWWSDPQAGTEYVIGQTYNVPYGTFIYAHWTGITDPVYLTVHINPTEGGTVPDARNVYQRGFLASITAVPNEGYDFDGWYKDGTKVCGTLNYTFTINENTELTAKFKNTEFEDFYWTPGDTDEDAVNIQIGKPITNITATVWNNRLKPLIYQLETAQEKSHYSIPTVVQGDVMLASDITAVRNAIARLNGGAGIIDGVNARDKILARMFANTPSGYKQSIKDAINNVIDVT